MNYLLITLFLNDLKSFLLQYVLSFLDVTKSRTPIQYVCDKPTLAD